MADASIWAERLAVAFLVVFLVVTIAALLSRKLSEIRQFIRRRNTPNNGTDYEDSMIMADAETGNKESVIELSLWMRPPSSTLGNGLPHQTQLIHDYTTSSSIDASRLQRLPNEILSMIISWLSKGDSEGGLAFFALRHVSRRFRRLTEGAEFQDHYFSTRHCCQWCSGGFEDLSSSARDPWQVRHCFEYNVPFPDLKAKVGKLMRKDYACKSCQRLIESSALLKDPVTYKFQALYPNSRSWSKCDPCGVKHPDACFARWQLVKPKSVCIGRQGHLRLCGHQTLTWDDIKSRIDEGQDGEGRILVGSCDHPDHSEPCSEGRGPQAFATKLPGGWL